jgi:hypothetical protein
MELTVAQLTFDMRRTNMGSQAARGQVLSHKHSSVIEKSLQMLGVLGVQKILVSWRLV